MKLEVFLFVVLLCGSVTAFMEDFFIDDPDFDMSYDDYYDDYDEDEEPAQEHVATTPSSTTSVPTSTAATTSNFTATGQESPGEGTTKTEVKVEDAYTFGQKECPYEEEIKELKVQITSVSNDMSKKISYLEDELRQSTAKVNNILEIMDSLVDSVNRLKGLGRSTQFQEITTPLPTPTPRAGVECKYPFRREAGGCFYLEEYNKKTWIGAQEYCKTLEASLAEPDNLERLSRHLHGSIGELGTRVRWPLWLGARRFLKTGKDSWFWLKKESKIPIYFWQGATLRDNWDCMALDGYNEYKPTSLDCDVSRRFLCERKESW
ncbi:uncharacterized protein LOC143026334 isoform X2 [Oratosquilla oratoria]|uniref:uncharacterized protein LOC143026334 isoform X2 n=1 Tax=Oratosquilla oratoria TaxID=337810 RepID=UPI003F763EE8